MRLQELLLRPPESGLRIALGKQQSFAQLAEGRPLALRLGGGPRAGRFGARRLE